MKKGISIFGICLFMLVIFGALHEVVAASLNLTLEQTGTDSVTASTSGLASTTIFWHGNILYSGTKVGEFNATYTVPSSGTFAYLTKYDLVIPGTDTFPDFVSMLVSHKPAAATLITNPEILSPLIPIDPIGPIGPIDPNIPIIRDTVVAKGTIYATSPGLAAALGVKVEILQPALLGASPYCRLTY